MKKLLSIFIYSLFFTLNIYSQNSVIQDIVNKIKLELVPDGRVCEYDVHVLEKNNKTYLIGRISDKTAYHKLFDETKKVEPSIIDSIRLLPNRIFGEKYWGIVPLSAIYIYAKPTFSSEMVTQALMGTPVKILDETEEWIQIQTPDGYIGWTITNIKRLNENELKIFNANKRAIVTANNALVYQIPDENSSVISELILGNIIALNNISVNAKFANVTLGNGKKGYIAVKNIQPWEYWQKNIQLTGENIIQLSKKFMGLPYFWGGTSSRGFDCSGFTKTIYFMHGIILPRDASQQYEIGTTVETQDGFEHLQKGDLLFFGRKEKNNSHIYKVVHVGIYLGEKKFIHASGEVRINSFDPKSADYDAYNRARFVGAKRVINVPMNGFWSVFQHPWYKQ